MWRTIGTELDIDVDTLNAIEKDDANDGSRLKGVINGANPAPTHEIVSKLHESANVVNAIVGMIMFHPPPPPPPLNNRSVCIQCLESASECDCTSVSRLRITY